MKRRHLLLSGLAAPAVLRHARAAYNVPTSPSIVRQQIIADYGFIPEVSPTVETRTLWETRVRMKNGMFPATDVRFALFHGFIGSNGEGEIPLPNPVTYQAAFEQITVGRAQVATFGSEPSLTLPAGSVAMPISNPFGANLLAGEVFAAQLSAQVANLGEDVAISRFNAAAAGTNGFNSYRSLLTTSQIGTAGTWSAVGRDAGNGGPGVTACIGLPSQNYVSLAGLGDSNLVGRDDATPDATGHYGHIAKAAFTSGQNGSAIPYIDLAQSGEQVTTMTSGLGLARSSLLRYVSHVVTNYGINDIRHGGKTVNQVTTALTAWWAALKARGLVIIEQTLPPWTTTTNAYADFAGQTIVAGWGPGGFRDQINAFKQTALSARQIDYIIDINTVLEDQSNPGYWRTNAGGPLTVDGQHAISLGHTLCVPVAQAVLQQLQMPVSPVRIP